MSTGSSSRSSAVLLKGVDFFVPNVDKNNNNDDDDISDSSMGLPSPVLFLHGLLGQKRNFASIATSLAQQLRRPRRLVGLDLRNHGDNLHDWRDEMTYRDMANDVLTYMDSNGMAKAVLVGHSMGGKVAQTLALLHPERVDGLVVLDIAPVQYSAHHDRNWKEVADIIHHLQHVGTGPDVSKRTMDQQLQETIPDPALRAFCLTNYDARSGQWKVNLKSIAAQMDALADFELLTGTANNNNKDNDSRQYQYDGDTFIIHGGQSRFVRHAHMDTIARFFPNHLLTTIRGAGHWVHADAPEDTTALLLRFLDR